MPIESSIAEWTDQGMTIGGGGEPVVDTLFRKYFRRVMGNFGRYHADPHDLLQSFERTFAECVPMEAWFKEAAPPHLTKYAWCGGQIWTSAQHILKYMFMMALANDSDGFALFEPAAKLMPGIIPLGRTSTDRCLFPVY